MIRPVLGVSLMGVMALGSALFISNEHAFLIASEPSASTWATQVVMHHTCVSTPVAPGEEVRGLFGVEVPSMASAERRTFDGAGQSVIYSMRATPEAVAAFYSERLGGNCWKQAADSGLTYVKDAHAVRIELSEEALTGTTYVAYAQGVVAGVSTENIVWAAQDGIMPPSPSGDSGTMPPPPNGGMLPPPGGQFMGQPGQFGPSQGGFKQGQNQFGQQQGFQPGGPGGFGPGQQNGFNPGGPGNFGPHQQNGFGPGGPASPSLGGPGNFGNQGQGEFSEQDMEQQERQMDEQRFQMMKMGAKQYQRMVKEFKKRIELMKKKMKGCALPPELDNALSAVDGLVAKIEGAQNADELEAVLSDIEDATHVMQESGQELPDYMRACMMKARIGKDMASLVRKANVIIKKGEKDTALTELVQALKDDIAAVQALVKEGESLAGTDVSEAGDRFEEAYDKFQDIGDGMEALDISLNLQKNLARLTKKVKSYEAAIVRKEKKKEDMSEERASFEEFKSSLSELQAAIKNKEGKDALVDLMQSLYETKQALDELLGGPVDGQSLVPKINVQEKGFDFQAPEGFERQMMPQGMGGFGPGGGPGGFGPSGDQGFGGSGGGFGQGIPQGGKFGAPGGGLQGQGQPTTSTNNQ